MKFFLCVAFVCFLISCNNTIDVGKVHSETRDSMGFKEEEAFATFDSQTFKPLSLPLTIDTSFIIKIDTTDQIPYQLIRQLGSSYLKNELSEGLDYSINVFCKIDSLKHNGEYQQYIDKLDIGMTKQSIGFKIGLVEFKNKAKLFLWGLTQSSFEACPFYNGTTIVGTYVNSGNKNTHFVVAEMSSAGDPPSMGSEEITAVIADEEIIIKGKSISDDLDAPGEETTFTTIVIEPGTALRILETKKEIKSTERTSR